VNQRRGRAAAEVILAAAVGVLSGCGGSCNSVPEPDACTLPVGDGVSEVLMGPGEAPAFVPFADEDVVEIRFGPQGGAMIPVRFRLSGSHVPSCVEQSLTVKSCPAGTPCPDGPRELLREVVPLHTYDIGDGVRETKALYLIFDPDDEPHAGDAVELVGEVAGFPIERRLWIFERGPDGGAADAGETDAAAIDASTVDAS
jgi:hypothetical protein